jgi:hypothetical protein
MIATRSSCSRSCGEAAIVRSILPELADTAGIDWSLPALSWSPDQMVRFLLLAQDLIVAAEADGIVGETFVVTLRPLPGVDPIRSLRWILKSLLRQHGMRCVNLDRK